MEREYTLQQKIKEEFNVEDDSGLFFTFESIPSTLKSKSNVLDSQFRLLASEYIKEPDTIEAVLISKREVYVISNKFILQYLKKPTVHLKHCININDINFFSITVSMNLLILHLNNGDSYSFANDKETNIKIINTICQIFNTNYSISKSIYQIPNNEEMIQKLLLQTSKENYETCYSDMLLAVSTTVNRVVPYDYREVIYKIVPIEANGCISKERYLILTNKKAIELDNTKGSVEVYPYSNMKAVSIISAKNCFNIVMNSQSSQFYISILGNKIIGLIALSHAQECISKLEINKY
jgi:hypothetical protein